MLIIGIVFLIVDTFSDRKLKGTPVASNDHHGSGHHGDSHEDPHSKKHKKK